MGVFYPVMRVKISFAKVMTIPPARVRKPLDRWDGSWDWRERPTWTIPQPSRIRPTARIRPKMNYDKMLTTSRGSSAAKAVMEQQPSRAAAITSVQ